MGSTEATAAREAARVGMVREAASGRGRGRGRQHAREQHLPGMAAAKRATIEAKKAAAATRQRQRGGWRCR